MIVVFVCVANSARSQMAEGLARHSAPPGVTVYSAGSQPATLNSVAVCAMAERGIDIAHHHSKGFHEVPLEQASYVITLCAEENCPDIPSNATHLSWALPDPATRGVDDESKLEAFRSARDEIADRLSAFWRDLDRGTTPA